MANKINKFKRSVVAAAACMTLAAPVAAQASSSRLVVAGTKLLDELVSVGVSESLSVALGLSSDEVGLSRDAFDEIATIVEDIVSTYQFSDYQTNVEDAIDLAEAYTRQEGSEALLGVSADRAWDCFSKATSALNDMESVGLQGTASFMLMASLQVAFLQEMAQVDELLGANGDSYREYAIDLAEDHLAHLEMMEADWEEVKEEKYEVSSRKVSQWYDGWYDNKKYRMCFTDDSGNRQCSPSTWTCKAPWYDTSAFAYSCGSSTAATIQANFLRDQQLARDTITIFGDRYDRFEDLLMGAVGGTGWLNGDTVNGAGDIESPELHDLDCDPIAVRCRRVSDGVDSSETGQVVTCDTTSGAVCLKDDQEMRHCDDYEVQFFCAI